MVHASGDRGMRPYGAKNSRSSTLAASTIDTSACQVHLLSGEYDWSAYPAASKALADAVPGASYTLMRGMGHFPMSEDPVRFKEYLMPVLAEIEAKP